MKRREPMKLLKNGITMDSIATDILAELPMAEQDNRYILVIFFYFTKWKVSFPMPNMDVATVARIIVEEVVARFVVPSSLHSDQGRQYES